MTQAELSRATGIARSVIANVLARRRGISADNALKLAEYFRVRVDLFLIR